MIHNKYRFCRFGVMLLSLIFCYVQLSAQSFTGSGGSIPDNGGPVIFEINIDQLPAPKLNKQYGLVSVGLNIQHSYDENLKACLMAPDGTLIKLFTNAGGNGKNFTQTILTDTASIDIQTNKVAPYTGFFKPQSRLGNCNNTQSGIGRWKLIIEDDAAFDAGMLIDWTLVFGYHPTGPDSFSSNLPIIIINTFNQPLESNIKKNGNIRILPLTNNGRCSLQDTFNHFFGNIDIQVRGMSSSFFPQQSYGITTKNSQNEDTSVSIVGLPEENDWLLIASYNDKSFIRNAMMYKLFSEMGHYAARTKHCEVFVNGEYQGIYILTEKIRRTANRLNLSKLKTIDTTGDDVTGGYIFQHDYITNEGWNSSVGPPECPTNVANYKYEYPSYANIQPAQANYIQQYVAQIESRLFGPDVNDSIKGYRPYIDLGSFIDYFICNEFAWNGDGFAKSMYFHKDKNSKDSTLHAGPIWDFDWALKRMPWVSKDVAGWSHTTYPCNNLQATLPWHFILMQDSFFQNNVRCRWNELRKNTLSLPVIHHYIDSMTTVLQESQVRHYQKWQTLGINVGTAELPPFAQTFQEEIDTLKALIARRLVWLDKNVPGTCKVTIPTDTTQHTDTTGVFDHGIKLYPNPVANTLFIETDLHQTVQQVSICTLNGQIILQQKVNQVTGQNVQEIDISALPSGFYLIHLQTSEQSYKRKLFVVR